ncbi:MAG: sulfite exporter TauE/SafE family protein [Bacillota bacterium]
MYLALADTFTNVIALFTIALAVGILVRFLGHPGCLPVVPALNIFGFPMSYAVGTGTAHLFARAIIDTFRQGAIANPDFRRGILLGLQTAAGVSIGKVILLTLADLNLTGTPVRWIYIVLLVAAGITLARNRISNSLPRLPRTDGLLPFAGLLAGIFTGFTGASGAIVLIPAMTILGMTRERVSAIAGLTMLLASGWGTFTFALDGRVEAVAVLVLVAGTTVGEQIGLLFERRVPNFAVRRPGYILLITTGLALALKQFGLTTPGGYLLWGTSILVAVFVVIRAIVGARVKAPDSDPAADRILV